MFNLDTYKTMTKDQLEEKIKDIEKDIKIRNSMPESARLNNLFIPLETQLEWLKDEWNRRNNK